MLALDATMPTHLPLPRGVGPYTVVRTTRRLSSNGKIMLFGTFMQNGEWSDIVMMRPSNSALAINANNNAQSFRTPLDLRSVGSSTATCCPAAITVQILNPNALQTTAGIIYGGVAKTQLPIKDRTDSWDEIGDLFVEFMAPRMMSAGKLALKGVKVSAYPLNMAKISEFTPLTSTPDVTGTWSSASGIFGGLDVVGFTPVVVVNPQQVALEFLVTTEWRVRFDLSNPAVASHVQHPLTTDQHWHSVISAASAMGHGVYDIPDPIAIGGGQTLAYG